MCDKCVDIEEKLARYRRLHKAVGDNDVIQRLREMIDELAAEKLALHPDGEESRAL
jgi:hypothetical protein